MRKNICVCDNCKKDIGEYHQEKLNTTTIYTAPNAGYITIKEYDEDIGEYIREYKMAVNIELLSLNSNICDLNDLCDKCKIKFLEMYIDELKNKEKNI